MHNKGLLDDIHPSVKLFFAILTAIFCTFIIIILGTVLALPFTEASFSSLLERELNLSDPAHLPYIKYFQILSHLGMFIIPSLLLAWFFGGKISGYIYADRYPGIKVIILSAAIVFVILPLVNLTHEYNMRLDLPSSLQGIENWMIHSEYAAKQATTTFLSVETIKGLLFNLFMIALIPAIGEEFFFRGVLYRIFAQWMRSPHFAVWVTALIFSAVHMQFYGFIPRLILGVVFGYLVIYSGSIWTAVVAHFINNAAAIIVFYLKHNNITDTTIDNIGKGHGGYILALLSLPVVVAIIMYINTTKLKQAGLKKNFTGH